MFVDPKPVACYLYRRTRARFVMIHVASVYDETGELSRGKLRKQLLWRDSPHVMTNAIHCNQLLASFLSSCVMILFGKEVL